MVSTNHGLGRRLEDMDSSNRRSGAANIFNIGEVLAQLSAEHPNVTASKIRFYEEKGLITPQRTPAGYRQFRDADVERLRFVLSLQRDHYLPLKVIREYLDAIDQGQSPQNLPPGVSIAPRMVSDEMALEMRGRSRRRSAAELRRDSGASEELLDAMISYGLVEAHDGLFGDHALRIAKACTELAAHGLEPRHLRPFQVAADREFGLVERAVAPLLARRESASAARAVEEAREIAGLCLGLHGALLQERIATMEAQ